MGISNGAFVVKNGLVVNGSLIVANNGLVSVSGNLTTSNVISANSLAANSAAIGNVSVNTTALSVGANVTVGASSISIGNSTVNVIFNAATISLGSNVSVNSSVLVAPLLSGSINSISVTVGNVVISNTSITSGPTVANSGGLFVNGFVTTASIGASTISANTYTLQSSDSGKNLFFSNTGVVGVTVPSGLQTNFRCICTYMGTANLAVSNAASVNLFSRTGAGTLTTQYSSLSIIGYVANVYIIDGSI